MNPDLAPVISNMVHAFIGICFLFITLFLFCPLRRWTFRRRTTIELINGSADASTSILLIHGTFARNAPWTRADNNFIVMLHRALAQCSICRVLWSGDNSHNERIRAAEHVAQWIRVQPSRKIYLIGHSHGGLIAALAATRVSDARVVVIALATPFINIATRYPGFVPEAALRDDMSDEKRLIVGLGIYALLGLGVVFALSGLVGIALDISIIGLAALLVAVIFASLDPDSALELVINTIREKGRRVCAESRICLPAKGIFILRTSADEASGFLATGQIFSWGFSVFFRFIGRPLGGIVKMENYFRSIFGGILRNETFRTISFSLILTGNASLMAIYRTHFLTFKPAVYACIGGGALVALLFILATHAVSLIVEPLLLLVSGAASFLFHLPFSIELATASLFVSISVESTPIGRWDITTVSHENAPFAHSLLHDSDEVARLIAQEEQTWR